MNLRLTHIPEFSSSHDSGDQVSQDAPCRISLPIYRDERGAFSERFRANAFAAIGLSGFVQDNFSSSHSGVLRGLHYQVDPGQGKLLTVLSGEIYDVIVDVRREKKTFGRWSAIKLSAQTPEWLWIPEGFAHGFLVTGAEDALVWYRCTNYYSPKGERGIRWNDPGLAIDWPIENPTLSPRDSQLEHLT